MQLGFAIQTVLTCTALRTQIIKLRRKVNNNYRYVQEKNAFPRKKNVPQTFVKVIFAWKMR